MRKFKPNRKLTLSIIAMGLSVLVVALALRPVFPKKEAHAPRVVMLSELYQTVVDDARAGYRDTITVDPERLVAATTTGREAAWTGGSDALGQLRSQLREAGLQSNDVGVQYQQPPSQ